MSVTYTIEIPTNPEISMYNSTFMQQYLIILLNMLSKYNIGVFMRKYLHVTNNN